MKSKEVEEASQPALGLLGGTAAWAGGHGGGPHTHWGTHFCGVFPRRIPQAAPWWWRFLLLQ